MPPRFRVSRLLLLCLAIVVAAAVPAKADTTLVFNEVMYHPATNEPAMEWVELYNQLAVDLDVSGWSITGDVNYQFPEGTRVSGRGYIVLAINPVALMAATGVTNVLGPFTNRLSNAGGTLRLRNKNSRVMDELSYGTEEDWPVAPDGAGPTLAKVDEDTATAEPANWRASWQPGGTPGRINTPRATTSLITRSIIPLNQSWKYDQTGSDLGTAWKEPGYDDSGWAAGSGVLAVEDNAAIRPLTNTVLRLTNPAGQRVITYYFRTHFTFTNDPAKYTFTAGNLLDDGAVVYLNGNEVYRFRVPTGQNFETLASNQANEGAFDTAPIPSTAVLQGENLLAVEVHQVNNTSSDVVFGLRLDDGVSITNAPMGTVTNLPIAFNEMPAVTNAQFWVELVNLSTQTAVLDGCVLARFGSPTNREYVIPSGSIAPGGFFVLDRATLGFGADPGDRVVLYGPGRGTVLDAMVAKSYPRARVKQGTGEWLRPSQPTPGATNQFALRNEIVINEIMYRHKAFPSVSGQPAQANPEEWIELFNRSGTAVSLGGWRVTGGISFQFPDNQVLGPGGYLVVAKDATTLRATTPGINIVGDFGGNLAGSGEMLRLEDANGNPADEVRYYTSGRWGEYARGGGSSLELRDPTADNTRAEAWAESDESGKSSWQTYSYRMVAQPSLTPNPDSTWRMFLLGLLAGGECLVDDIRVIASPTNNPVSLVDNGGFENGIAGWRVLGNHVESSVITEPGNPGNRVLHLKATGPQEHMHNHIEATLANGQSVVNGTLYEISYRARWLAGKSLLNTRLWFNRVARTMELPAPQNNGTPGAVNSRYEPNIGPTFAEFQHQPVAPPADVPVTVSAQVSDPQAVTNCQVFWSVGGGTFFSAPMTGNADGTYSGAIPGYGAGSVVQFYVRAVDGQGAVSTFPARGTNGGAFYKVNDGLANVALQHNLRILTTPQNAALLHADTNVMSNGEVPCTVIYDERVALYDVALRLKGSMNGRPFSARVGFHLSFQPDELFRGVHPTVGLDRRPGDSSPRNEEIVVRHIAHHVGGVPVMYFDVVNVHAPRSTENGPALIQPSYEDDFLDSSFENGGDGTLYEMDGIYNSTTANAAGYRLPQPNNSQNYVDVADRGNDKEVYRYQFIRKNNHDQDDFAPLITMSKAFSATGPAFETQTRALMDMDEWLRAYAVVTLCGVSDTYSFGLQHNLMFYFRPEDNKAIYLMWDSDFSFTRSATSPVVGDQNLARIVNLPSNLRALYAHLLDIMDSTYNTAYMSYWLTHYAGFSGTSYSSRLSYIQQRSDYVRSVIASGGGNAAFAVTSTNLTVNSSNVVTLTGTAPVRVKTITVNGIAWPVTWNSLTGWTIRVPVSGATNTLEIEGLDLDGDVVANTSFTATAVVNATRESPVGNVVFNEIMYDPAVWQGGYVEILNRATNTTFDLSGWVVNGLGYTFPPGSSIGPRSYLVLAKNRIVYTSTYGAGVPFDEFPGELQLDGETLTLVRRGATPEQDLAVDKVRYEGELPWPAAATHGTGSSYQLIDASQDNSRAGNWAARHVPPVYEGGMSIPAATNVGWRFVSLTGSIGNGIGSGQQRLLIYLGEINGASAIIDDVSLVAGTNPATGYNFVRNGDFEVTPLLDNSPVTNSWIVNTNYTNSVIVSDLTHSGVGALRIEASTFGNAFGRVISQNLSPAPPVNSTNTLSFWFWSTNSATNLFVRIQNSAALNAGASGTNINPSVTPSNYVPPVLVSPGTNYLTPGATNQLTASLLAFPTLWINEVQTEHLGGHVDNHGEADPWVELYNSGTNAVSLSGLYLSSGYTNLVSWAFPAGSSIGPTQFMVVVCDGDPAQSDANQQHTSFRLPASSGSVVLSRLHNGQPQVMDYINYAALATNRSFGSFPDGQPFDRQEFHYLTPGAPNDGRAGPLAIYINEWMAQNSSTLADPSDGQFEDWFELYNPGTNAVSLAGYFLTDNLSSRFAFAITTNMAHIVQPGGHLLVWADGEPNQNLVAGTQSADLHAGFALSVGGEAIGLFGPDGTQVDAVAFGRQTNDVSMGRIPDGGATILFMPGTASPRAANYIGGGNRPPLLVPVGNKVVYVGQSLAFNATASDTDIPTQTLTFVLAPGAPAGAAIQPTGLFSWTPGAAGTNTVTITVTDNGTPPLSDSETITIEVLGLPRFAQGVRRGDNIELTWPTHPGQSYAVDHKHVLNATAWTPLWTNVAAGDWLSFTNDATNGQGFFRIRVLSP